MKADLIVNNFGPIKSVNLDLRNVNVFIGPQASGKSALAKVYTICKSPLSFFKEDANEAANVVNFKKKLDEYNIGSFLKEDTFIEFSSELHYFKFEKNQIVYKRYLLQKINRLDSLITDDSNNNEIVETIWELRNKLYSFHQYILINILNANATTSKEVLRTELQKLDFDFKILESIVNGLNDLEFSLSINPALYIPSERGIIPIIRGTILNLLNNDVPLPKHILAFGAEYEKASALKNVLDLGFIQENLSYKFENGEERIFFENDKSIRLLEAASGIQSIVPLLLPILSKRESNPIAQYSFVIEEPELNLFPKAQYELIKLLEKNRFNPIPTIDDIGTIHTYTTHSPYVLSSFNTFLYSYKVRFAINNKKLIEFNDNFVSTHEYMTKNVDNLFPAFINPENFSAYQISNGGAEQIINRETGLIDDNFIDDASDEMGDDFDKLMELMETETI